ncbi:MAG: MBL fold metallo-hydrolase, partial [Fervidobacterium sp.]
MLVEDQGFRLLIDHGLLSKALTEIKPEAILITHAHPDHFLWLKKDEEFQGKIYLTQETEKLAKFWKNFEIIKKNQEFKVGPFRILAYPVVHSLRAPAVGFKVTCRGKIFVYNPDIVVMEDRQVLSGVDLYIGDGS